MRSKNNNLRSMEEDSAVTLLLLAWVRLTLAETVGAALKGSRLGETRASWHLPGMASWQAAGMAGTPEDLGMNARILTSLGD